MANIHCRACGTIYRYEKEGCCPNCGAYNRPPNRERVSSDGTVQHLSNAAYERRQHAQGKVCFEKKECHEQQVCYEDQARKAGQSGVDPRRGDSALIPDTPEPKPSGPVKYSEYAAHNGSVKSNDRAQREKKSPMGCLIAFISIIILLSAVAVVATQVFSSLINWN